MLWPPWHVFSVLFTLLFISPHVAVGLGRTCYTFPLRKWQRPQRGVCTVHSTVGMCAETCATVSFSSSGEWQYECCLTPRERQYFEIQIYCLVTQPRCILRLLLVWCCISEGFCPCILLAQKSFEGTMQGLRRLLPQNRYNLALHTLLYGCSPKV